VKKITKALIPAAGLGTRMYPITKAQAKEMVPVVHKPVIQYVIEEAFNAGIKDILIITGKGKDAIENHFDLMADNSGNKYLEDLEKILEKINIYYIRQKELKGLGDAVSYGESFIGDEPFALLLGDTITNPPCIKELIDINKKYQSSIIAVEEVPQEKVSSYGIISGIEIEPGIFEINDLIEKPTIADAPSNLAILGSYILTPEIFSCIKKTPPGHKGEFQLTDALKLLIEEQVMYAYHYLGRRYDIGNKSDWLKANIELALVDKELGQDIREFLRSV
jgi:UTP--glucose-1-phosphate uridylyltransferase